MTDDDDVRLSWMAFNDIMKAISELENRIIQLEVQLSKKRLVMDDDSWYWDH